MTLDDDKDSCYPQSMQNFDLDLWELIDTYVNETDSGDMRPLVNLIQKAGYGKLAPLEKELEKRDKEIDRLSRRVSDMGWDLDNAHQANYEQQGREQW